MYKITYNGDGVETRFTFAFPFFQPADIRVSINDGLVGTDMYSVIPNDEFTGGCVVFADAPARNSRIDIFRMIELSRVIDYQPTAKIDPEDLNTDFNFLLAALADVHGVEINMAEWKNTHDTVLAFLHNVYDLVTDRVGGANLGIYNNLVSVLSNALPALINDYGYVTDPAPNETRDDYGIL